MAVISFHATTLNALRPLDRERLLLLTLPPRHPGDQSVFKRMLLEPMAHAFYFSTIVLVAVEEHDGEPAATQWLGWTVAWWRPGERVARVGVFVAEHRRRERWGQDLVRRLKLATEALGMKLRANATSDAGARLFEKLGVENDARHCPCGALAVAGYSDRAPRCAKCWTDEALDQPG